MHIKRSGKSGERFDMFIQTENSRLQAGRFLQHGAMSQIVGSPGVDIHHAPSFNGVDDRTAEFLRDSRKLRPKRPPLIATEGSA